MLPGVPLKIAVDTDTASGRPLEPGGELRYFPGNNAPQVSERIGPTPLPHTPLP